MRTFTASEFRELRIVHSTLDVLFDVPFVTEGLAKQQRVDLVDGDTVYYVIKTYTTDSITVFVEKAIIKNNGE